MWSILVMHQVINGVKVIGSGSSLNQISLSGTLEDVSVSPCVVTLIFRDQRNIKKVYDKLFLPSYYLWRFLFPRNYLAGNSFLKAFLHLKNIC